MLLRRIHEYQSKHPDPALPKRPGRVALQHRATLNKELTELILPKELSEILCSSDPPLDVVSNLQRHALRACNGDTEEARMFLERHNDLVHKSVREAKDALSSQPNFGKGLVLRQNASQKTYIDDTEHLLSTHLTQVRGALQTAATGIGR